MHPVIEEMSRVHTLGGVQIHAFRKWQRILRDEVQPMLTEREALLVEVADLKAEIERLLKRGKKAEAVAS